MDSNNGLRLHEAIAICHNMEDPAERKKFSDHDIDCAIRLIIEASDIKYVTKTALFNALKFQTKRLDKWKQSTTSN
mgnify:CR=1 FL=1